MQYDLVLSRKIWTAPARRVYVEMQTLNGQPSDDFDKLNEQEKDFYRAHAQRNFGDKVPKTTSASR